MPVAVDLTSRPCTAPANPSLANQMSARGTARLTQALKSLFNNPKWAREMGARGRDCLTKTFSFARFQSHLTQNQINRSCPTTMNSQAFRFEDSSEEYNSRQGKL